MIDQTLILKATNKFGLIGKRRQVLCALKQAQQKGAQASQNPSSLRAFQEGNDS